MESQERAASAWGHLCFCSCQYFCFLDRRVCDEQPFQNIYHQLHWSVFKLFISPRLCRWTWMQPKYFPTLCNVPTTQLKKQWPWSCLEAIKMPGHKPRVQPQVAAERGRQDKCKPLGPMSISLMSPPFIITIICATNLVGWVCQFIDRFLCNIILSISNYLLGKLMCKMFIGGEKIHINSSFA